MLRLTQKNAGLEITSCFQFFAGLPAVRAWSEVRNLDHVPLGLEYLSSLRIAGFEVEKSTDYRNLRVTLPLNGWAAEHQIRNASLPDFGIEKLASLGMNTRRLCVSNTGSMSTKEYSPIAVVEDTVRGRFIGWQIEASGSWNWELSEADYRLYLQLSGPSWQENGWYKKLEQGQSFVSEAAVAVFGEGNAQNAFQLLNRYRHRLVRQSGSPVIFNDYMHCLFANPSTERVLPVVQRAAELGAEFYIMDAGWYGDDDWMQATGEWKPSEKRFPNGMNEIFDRVRQLGMKPGIWLEIERMGQKYARSHHVGRTNAFSSGTAKGYWNGAPTSWTSVTLWCESTQTKQWTAWFPCSASASSRWITILK